MDDTRKPGTFTQWKNNNNNIPHLENTFWIHDIVQIPINGVCMCHNPSPGFEKLLWQLAKKNEKDFNNHIHQRSPSGSFEFLLILPYTRSSFYKLYQETSRENSWEEHSCQNVVWISSIFDKCSILEQMIWLWNHTSHTKVYFNECLAW